MNFVSTYSFAHGKTSNQQRLQRETYPDVRGQFRLPAQMARNVPRQVGSTYRDLWTKVRKNAEARRLGYTKKRYKGLDNPPKYVSPTLTYSYHRDYSLKGDEQVSILTLQGRVIVSYQGYTRHRALLREGATIGAAKLWYDRSKKRRKGKRLVPVSPKARKTNRHASKWAFAELHGLLAYKAVLSGSHCVKVDAHYTSQMCPRCGLTSPDNRPQKGLLFVCRNPRCHYTLHADLVGARNIALRTLLVWQDWTSTGSLSGSLDVADDEAKAARRQRYAELRWSLATSPSPSGDSGS